MSWEDDVAKARERNRRRALWENELARADKEIKRAAAELEAANKRWADARKMLDQLDRE